MFAQPLPPCLTQAIDAERDGMKPMQCLMIVAFAQSQRIQITGQGGRLCVQHRAPKQQHKPLECRLTVKDWTQLEQDLLDPLIEFHNEAG